MLLLLLLLGLDGSGGDVRWAHVECGVVGGGPLEKCIWEGTGHRW